MSLPTAHRASAPQAQQAHEPRPEQPPGHRRDDAGPAAAGVALRGAVAALARLRPAAKPLHPRGEVEVGRLVRSGRAPRSGAAFLDEVGDDEVLVRRSRGVGLPEPWPDVNGLAIRVPAGDGAMGDLLLSTTGWGRLSRWVLAPHLRAEVGRYSTLVPYRSPGGPVLLGARAVGPGGYVLAWARPTSRWHDFGELRLTGQPGEDVRISFDPVLNRPDGLTSYDAVVRLREPAYDVARRLRGSRA